VKNPPVRRRVFYLLGASSLRLFILISAEGLATGEHGRTLMKEIEIGRKNLGGPRQENILLLAILIGISAHE
jgi:hypothetical protein